MQREFIKNNLIDVGKDKKYINEAAMLLMSNLQMESIIQMQDEDIAEDIFNLLNEDINDLIRLSIYCKNHENILGARFSDTIELMYAVDEESNDRDYPPEEDEETDEIEVEEIEIAGEG